MRSVNTKTFPIVALVMSIFGMTGFGETARAVDLQTASNQQILVFITLLVSKYYLVKQLVNSE